MEEKKTYYVSVASGEISQIKYGNNADFVIQATQQEIEELRRKITKMDAADMGSFWRSHIPFEPYHNDRANDIYDKSMTETFQLLYELGDSETRTHIDESGILSDRPIKTTD